MKVTHSKPPAEPLEECNKEKRHKYTLQACLVGHMHIFIIFKTLKKCFQVLSYAWKQNYPGVLIHHIIIHEMSPGKPKKKKLQWKVIRRDNAQTTQITESNQAFTNMICKYEPDYRIVHDDQAFLKTLLNN